jgi:hypothetical protein
MTTDETPAGRGGGRSPSGPPEDYGGPDEPGPDGGAQAARPRARDKCLVLAGFEGSSCQLAGIFHHEITNDRSHHGNHHAAA